MISQGRRSTKTQETWKSNPIWAPLRDDLQFKELMQRVKVGREQRKLIDY